MLCALPIKVEQRDEKKKGEMRQEWCMQLKEMHARTANVQFMGLNYKQALNSSETSCDRMGGE
jgi:hypothetical protein